MDTKTSWTPTWRVRCHIEQVTHEEVSKQENPLFGGRSLTLFRIGTKSVPSAMVFGKWSMVPLEVREP